MNRGILVFFGNQYYTGTENIQNKRECTDDIRRDRVLTMYIQETRILQAPNLAIYVICAPSCTYQIIQSYYSDWHGTHCYGYIINSFAY